MFNIKTMITNLTILCLLILSQGLYAQIDTDKYYYLQARHSGKYVQLSKKSKENGVVFNQWDKTGESTQQFRFQHLGEGYYKITSRYSGKALDVSQVSKWDGAKFHQWDYQGTDNQKFKAKFTTVRGAYYFVAKHSGKNMDVSEVSQQNGAVMHQWRHTGAANQQFKLIPVVERSTQPKPVPQTNFAGYYKIKVKATKTYWHEDGLGDKLVSTRHQSNDDFAVFKLIKLSDGSYRIQVKANQRYLYYNGQGDKLLSTRTQSSNNYTRFFFESQKDGSYRIRSRADNRYLHCDGLGDKLISTRAQETDDFTRFYLEPYQQGSTVKDDCFSSLPNPQIYVKEKEALASGSIRYTIPVKNFRSFPNKIFEAAPNLPPCGKNNNSSRTWISIYDGNDRRIYGFCGFKSNESLQKIWVALKPNQTKYVYVVLTDRACNKKYISNKIAVSGEEQNTNTFHIEGIWKTTDPNLYLTVKRIHGGLQVKESKTPGGPTISGRVFMYYQVAGKPNKYVRRESGSYYTFTSNDRFEFRKKDGSGLIVYNRY